MYDKDKIAEIFTFFGLADENERERIRNQGLIPSFLEEEEHITYVRIAHNTDFDNGEEAENARLEPGLR